MALRLESTHKVTHVTLSGTMLGGGEMWQTGFYIGAQSADSPVPTQEAADAIRDAWITFFTSAQGNIHPGYKFTTAKLSRLLKTGFLDGEPVQSHATGVVSGGAISSTMYPPQISLVATTYAGSGKGIAGKGRMYLPGVNAALDGTGHIISPAPQDIATKLSQFFNTINGSIPVGARALNVSRGSANILGANARSLTINGVRVGNVYDTQRRRRNALAEQYFPATVAD